MRQPAPAFTSQCDGSNLLADVAQRWRTALSQDERECLHAELEALLFRSDPADFLHSLPADLWEPALVNAALQRWVEQSPKDALIWLQAQPDRESYSQNRDWALAAWARVDHEDALRWVLGQAEGTERSHLLAWVAIGYAEDDPELAAAIVRDLVPPGLALHQAIEGIAVAWSRSDPASAATWALGSADPVARSKAVDLVLYSWFDDDPAAVQAWVRSRPDAIQRDLLRAQMVRWQFDKDPSSTGAIVAEITDGPIRAQTASNFVRRWARQDFDLAGQWTLDLPASPLRTRLVTELATITQE